MVFKEFSTFSTISDRYIDVFFILNPPLLPYGLSKTISILSPFETSKGEEKLGFGPAAENSFSKPSLRRISNSLKSSSIQNVSKQFQFQQFLHLKICYWIDKSKF